VATPPTNLLKLYIYGYLNRVRSSRRLEADTHCKIDLIWLLRHLKPDFKTIVQEPGPELPPRPPSHFQL
jgi:transposase